MARAARETRYADRDGGRRVTGFNEDARVKIPALLHPTRLGYQYLSLKHAN